MLTLFSVPKSFEGKYIHIQENAIKSWLESIHPRPEILLLGNEKGTREVCRKLNIVHISNINTNRFGTPLLDDIFKKASSRASNRIMVYINSDIIVSENLDVIIHKVISTKKPFLATGRRYEMMINSPINFDDRGWRGKFIKQCNQHNLKNSAWLDYFIFPKFMFSDIPPFALGRTFWDKWLVWKAHSSHYPVIDLTEKLHPIHQSHGYDYGLNSTSKIWEGEEALENIRLAGGWSHGMDLDSVFQNNTYSLTHILKKIVDRAPCTWPTLIFA